MQPTNLKTSGVDPSTAQAATIKSIFRSSERVACQAFETQGPTAAAGIDVASTSLRPLCRGATLAIFALLAGLLISPSAWGQRNPAFEPIEDDPTLPRVLLIGDSISIGYTLAVREELDGVANVHRPPENCASTRTGLERLDAWLGDKPWDVIHFNFGLHDLKHVPPGETTLVPVDTEGAQHQVPIEEYQQNLERIVRRLKQTDAKLIWRNTTPVPAGATGRIPEDVAKYNQVARNIMQEHGIALDDLHAFAAQRLDAIQRPRNVHFTSEGSRELAQQVAEAIRRSLPEQE